MLFGRDVQHLQQEQVRLCGQYQDSVLHDRTAGAALLTAAQQS